MTEIKFQIGDKVKFIDNDNKIPTYFDNCLPANIPYSKLIHGSILLGDVYKKEFAKIVDIHNEYLIVEWTDAYNTLMRLGFLPESLIFIPVQNKIHLIHNPFKMNDIIKFARDLTLSKEDKLLRKYGLVDETGNPTESYSALVRQKLEADNKAYVVEMAQKMAEDKLTN